MSIPARTVLMVKLNVRDLKGKPMPVGTAGVNSAAIEGLGIWSTLDASDWGGQISAVVVNTADVDRYIQNNEILGLFDPVKEEFLSVESVEEKIDAVFNSFKEDPATKPDDFVPTSMSSEEKDFLLSQL